ncbi:MAG: hypothetical protein ACE5HS_03800 [bacterium]
MRKMNKLSVIFLTSILIVCSLSPLFAGVGVQSVGVNFGWYRPSLNYWNTKSDIANWSSSFNGSFIGQVNLVATLIPPLRARIELGYWRESVKQQNTRIGIDIGTEEVTLNLIPITATLLVDLPFVDYKGITAYAGAGASSIVIRKTYLRAPRNFPYFLETKAGLDNSAHFILGAEKQIAKGLSFGVEFRYLLGSYIQLVEDTPGVITEEKVSISGPQIFFSWIYLLHN